MNQIKVINTKNIINWDNNNIEWSFTKNLI